jgi:hypothetical protein
MAPPRPVEILPTPAETNTSHTGRLCEKTLQEHPRSCKALGATPAGALARPHGTAQHLGGKNVTSASIILCRILTGTTAEARGLLSGIAIGSPKNRGKPISFANNKTETTTQIIKHARDNHGTVAGAHGPGGLSGPPEQSAPAPLGRNSISLEGHCAVLTRLRLARGPDAPSGETPPRSRAGRPLGRVSASLDGRTPPRASLRLARGSHGLAAPATTPPEHLMF